MSGKFNILDNMIEYLPLKRITALRGAEIREAVNRVVDSGWYLRGKETETFEQSFAAYTGKKYCATCGNGLDALSLIIRSYKEIGMLHDDDEIIVPANTYIASILSITENGLKAVLVEPDKDNFQIDDKKIEEAITSRTKAIMIVHLYGENAYTDRIGDICKRNKLILIEDCAQAHGLNKLLKRDNRPVADKYSVCAYSFYPGKNLGALGDAGAVVTNDKEICELVKAMGNYGSSEKYVFPYQGRNSRMDEIQAAVLSVKLKYLDAENNQRREIARSYIDNVFNPLISLPSVDYWQQSVFHIFPVFCEKRVELRQFLLENGVQTMIHYPIPPHKQGCYSSSSVLMNNGSSDPKDFSLSITEKIHDTELSIPLNQAMTPDEVGRVIDILNKFY